MPCEVTPHNPSPPNAMPEGFFHGWSMTKYPTYLYVLAFVLSVIGTAFVIGLAILGGEVALLAFIAIALVDAAIILYVRSIIS